MSDTSAPDLTAAERVDDIPRTLRALRQAIEDALQRHKRDGDRVVIWRNGRVEWVQPEDIPEAAPAQGEE